MDTKTQLLYELWLEARSRLEEKIKYITPEDLTKALTPSKNSIGFLLRHIAEVELLFAKNVFGASSIKIIAKTVIAKRDTGEWTNLESITKLLAQARYDLGAIIESQTEEDWETEIETTEFGIKTKAEALGRIVSHTAYHAGQIGIIKKYGI
ncbi:DinB family protein [Dokdonia sp. MED134]|uniref:DinB family protein n=1 Tax=Dokdonia sp. MED134 TaxID=313590 RepID=UPI000068E4FD|nr:DinB family protein [Dokdonia sp. MED134]EAQ38858.1 DinB family protein [Dokdonia sp. MED134]